MPPRQKEAGILVDMAAEVCSREVNPKGLRMGLASLKRRAMIYISSHSCQVSAIFVAAIG